MNESFQFFPEANEVEFARKAAFEGASFKLDYLTKPSFFEDFGFTEKVKMTDRVKPEDELFLAAYPYFNVSGSSKHPFFPLLGKGTYFLHKMCMVCDYLMCVPVVSNFDFCFFYRALKMKFTYVV